MLGLIHFTVIGKLELETANKQWQPKYLMISSIIIRLITKNDKNYITICIIGLV